ENYINSLISNYHKNSNTKEKITNDLADILDNLNYFHPFREGNGRTQREVIRVLAMMKNYEAIINIGADDNIYNLYMDGTVYSDKSKLNQLFNIILKKL
ncbi:MAG: Fic family protein, partial [Gemella haemolysans]|nr:Fic family protein [Gemella haemolysans]